MPATLSSWLRGAGWHIPVVAVSGIFAVVLLFVMGERGTRLVVAVLGAAMIAGGAVLSGNVRLFCLWAFMLSLPFDLSYRMGTVFPKLGGETALRVELSDLFWGALLAYLIRDLWTGAARGVRIPKVAWLWVALAMLGIWAVVAGPWRMTALHEVVRMGKMFLILVILCHELKTPERILHAATALIVALLIQALVGLVQYATGSGLGLAIFGEADIEASGKVVTTASVVRVGAFMVHPVIFATFLATVLPIALGLALVRVGRLRRVVFALAVLLGVPALILTLSRAGWLTFFVTTTVLTLLVLLRVRLRRKALIPLALAGGAMLAVLIALSGPIAARIFKSNPESALGRAEWREDAKRMIAVKPWFGWGLNSYAFAVPPFTRLGERGAREFYEKARFGRTRFIPVVHNAYLQWLAEIGVAGLTLHLAIFAVLLHVAWRNLRVRHEGLFVLNAACLAGLVGYLVDLNFGNSLRQGSTLREFWVLAAFVYSISYWRLRHEAAQPVGRASSLPAAGALAGR